MTTMNSLNWIRRSIRHHLRMHLVLAGGAALAGTVLAAVLLAGDALNANLHRIALMRIGTIRSAIELRGRYADAALADRLSDETGMTVAPLLRLVASLLSVDASGREARIDRVNAYGTDARFFALAGSEQPRPPDENNAVLLSSRVLQGMPDTEASLSLRFEKPSLFPGDMPLGDRGTAALRRRPVKLAGELPETALGRFSLRASQVPPLNLFARRDWLGAQAELADRVNLFLSDAAPAALETALKKVFRSSDLGLGIGREADDVWLVRPERIYMAPAFVQALELSDLEPILTLHHLADSFVAGEGSDRREQPYGFITAQTPAADLRLGVLPIGMADDEVVINEWLAEKLDVDVGDRLTIQLRRFEVGGRLVPDQASFRIIHILDMPEIRHERDWLPAFPGLTDADRCADWDIGMPMDAEKLNDPDNEDYWNAYGPTPKAFITHNAGQALLGTLFGSAMSARLSPETEEQSIWSALHGADPAALGLTVRPVREEALAAVDQAMDFREIFGSLAFVLVVSALILTGLLAALGVSQRREELGILRAAGFSSHRLARLWMLESLPSLLVGSVAGALAGVLGARLLVWGLNRFWSGAIASAPIPFSVGTETCVLAAGVTLLLSMISVYAGIHRTVHRQIADLLGDETEIREGRGSRRWVRWTILVGMVALLLAAGLFVMGAGDGAGGSADSGLFFGGGALLMTALLCLAPLLVHMLQSRGRPATDPWRGGLYNVARYRGRSLMVMILLASGCFLTVGVLSMKQDPAADSDRSGSGSGGYDLMVELSIPMPASETEPLLQDSLGAGALLLPMRVREGDEASCLNLNRAIEPRLLGVSPSAATAQLAFESPKPDSESVWSILEKELPDGSIPVLAGDLTTVQYGLAARTGPEQGTVYTYTGEDGRVWRLRLMGALPVRTGILQGSLIMNRSVFTRMFPSASGDGLWLVRCGLGEADAKERLVRSLGRYGGLVTPSRERLRLLGEVESTYLDMFLVLGGLGVVLGAAGVGLVVLRNAAARRRELAILRALGIPPRQTLLYLLAEYIYLLLGGLVAGVVPALVAVQPAMRNLGQAMPVGLMALLIAGMFASGFVGVFIAVLTASRMRLTEALRGE